MNKKHFTYDMTFEQFIENLLNKTYITELFVKNIVDTQYQYCYLEFPPFSNDTKNNKCEFIIIEATSFPKGDYSAFSDIFNKSLNKNNNATVVAFPNLSGDTMLICPLPKYMNFDNNGSFVTNLTNNRYNSICNSDLMSFLQLADTSIIYDLFSECAKQLLNLYKNQKKVYFSTHGRGISWLHIRLCTQPNIIYLIIVQTKNISNI